MRLVAAAAIALLLPVSVTAQGAPAAPGAATNPITTVFRGRTMTLQRNLAQAFDSIPESLFNYKPTPAQLTVGYIAQHLASDNYLFCNNFGAKKATVAPEDATTPDSVKAKWPRAQLITKMKASFAFCEEAFAQLDDANLGEQVTMQAGGNTRSFPRAQMVLGHVIDMADHYSQISNYMRLNNILPPTALPRPARP
ncbi:MAG: DinB family protein [Gemmatimonadota bacterium]